MTVRKSLLCYFSSCFCTTCAMLGKAKSCLNKTSCTFNTSSDDIEGVKDNILIDLWKLNSEFPVQMMYTNTYVFVVSGAWLMRLLSEFLLVGILWFGFLINLVVFAKLCHGCTRTYWGRNTSGFIITFKHSVEDQCMCVEDSMCLRNDRGIVIRLCN